MNDMTKWKLVPIEPTVEMKIAGDNAGFWCGDKYRAMLDAAPSAPAVDPHGEREAFLKWVNKRAYSPSQIVVEWIWDAWQARAALSARASEAAAGEPVAIYHGNGIVDCGDCGHLNVELLKLIPAGSKLYTAHPAASGQKLTDELIGIAAKYIQTGYLHDFTNEVRALLRASDSATASDKEGA